MTKDILNWAEEQGLLSSNTPQLHMLHVQREVGNLAMAAAFDDVVHVEQAIAETVINLTIVAELFGLNIDTCVEKGFKKGQMDVNDAQLIAALQDSNFHYIRQIDMMSKRIGRLTDEVDKLNKRTIYVPKDEE